MRIGSKIWYWAPILDETGYQKREYHYNEADDVEDVRPLGSWNSGKLLFWSTGHIHTATGPAPWPVAVILDSNTKRTVVIQADKLSETEPAQQDGEENS